jgi:hypothetical protein
MEETKKLILDVLPEGVLKTLAERDLTIAGPEDYGIFPRAIVNVTLPNIKLKIERFIETNHWWIADDIYDYYTQEELDNELSCQIAKSIEWIEIQ